MVRKSLKAAQFKTIDAGKGISPDAFVAKAKQANADILVVTVGLTAAKENLPKLIAEIENEGLKGKITVMIGGAAAASLSAAASRALLKSNHKAGRFPIFANWI